MTLAVSAVGILLCCVFLCFPQLKSSIKSKLNPLEEAEEAAVVHSALPSIYYASVSGTGQPESYDSYYSNAPESYPDFRLDAYSTLPRWYSKLYNDPYKSVYSTSYGGMSSREGTSNPNFYC